MQEGDSLATIEALATDAEPACVDNRLRSRYWVRNGSLQVRAVKPDFGQTEEAAAERLIEWGLADDLGNQGDITCRALIDPRATTELAVVAREPGVLAGIPVAAMVFGHLDRSVTWSTNAPDGSQVQAGTVVATVRGPLSALLSGERVALNVLTHLSGIATVTRRFVDAVAGTRARILDTRKTLPGWRMLQKYAVRAGGGTNHRMGLYDGVLIKDNHLAAWAESARGATIADAIRQARQDNPNVSVEVEVDTLDQLKDALAGDPDIVLLDNMDCDTLRQAVALRDGSASEVLLEASGSVSLDTVAEIARTGVERISIGALTHSAPALDLAFDWRL